MSKAGRALVAASLCLSSCGPAAAEPVDLTAPETWLSPEELSSGRKIKIVGTVPIYIGTAAGCIAMSFVKPGRPASFDPGARGTYDLVSLISGSLSQDYAPPRVQNVVSNLNYYYARIAGRLSSNDKRMKLNSLKCHRERGDTRYKGVFPDRSFLYIQSEKYRPKETPELFRGLEVKTFELSDRGGIYCRVRLGFDSNLIAQSRIDVLDARRPIPVFGDVREMDCIMRGLLAAGGFPGILRFSREQIYGSTIQDPEANVTGDYLGRVLEGFFNLTVYG